MSTHTEDQDHRSVTAPDGRRLEFRLTGPPGGRPVVFHHGAPGAAVPFGPLERAAADRGLRVLTVSRPGYGTSDPLPDDKAPGTVADAVADTLYVLDQLGAAEFFTLGWSSGAPRALACAALLPGRCRAAGRSLRPGVVGWRDDDLAVDRPWGVAVEQITVPTGRSEQEEAGATSACRNSP